MIIWGGQSNFINVKTGGQYDVVSNTWLPTDTINAPCEREVHTAVWTGNKMIIWGGWVLEGSWLHFLNNGAMYDPVLDSWTQISTLNAPTGRIHHTAIWTGDKMIVWGGSDSISLPIQGGIYDPETDTWTPTSTLNAPIGREWHTAIWTGDKMIVWGGDTQNFTPTNSGGIYDPVQNSWIETSIVDAPSSRFEHSAVWTGTEMIIWGGVDNTGGIYDPITHIWKSTSILNAPVSRYVHTAAWTGIKMFIWGGISNNYLLNTGGIYDPISDSWQATSISNAPLHRVFHSSVWTGQKIIIWGGATDYGPTNRGGIYTNPSIISVENLSGIIPDKFMLHQNFPNPFNPGTKIKFSLPKSSFVNLAVYDVLGREIVSLVKEELKAGYYNIEWNAGNYPSGVYFYTLRTDNFSETKKMILIK